MHEVGEINDEYLDESLHNNNSREFEKSLWVSQT